MSSFRLPGPLCNILYALRIDGKSVPQWCSTSPGPLGHMEAGMKAAEANDHGAHPSRLAGPTCSVLRSLRIHHSRAALRQSASTGQVGQAAAVTKPTETTSPVEQSRRKDFTLPYVKDPIPTDTADKRRPGTAMTPLYLTIHSTGNPKSKSKGERSWLTNKTNDRQASFHVVVDETQAVECIPLTEVAWHAGDGNGDGNRKSIGLEICESGDREKTLRNAIDLAAKILRDHGWSAAALRRHYDWSKKDCPRILINKDYRGDSTQTWEWFTAEVAKLL